jgi:hypothetical protein
VVFLNPSQEFSGFTFMLMKGRLLGIIILAKMGLREFLMGRDFFEIKTGNVMSLTISLWYCFYKSFMNQNIESRFQQFAGELIDRGEYKVFDRNARLINRQKLIGLDSVADSGLVILNAQGDAILLTEEFEQELLRVLQLRYQK